MADIIDQASTCEEIRDDLPVLRRHLEAQSFLNQSCEILHALKNWWRFTPTISWMSTLIGTVMVWPEILFTLAVLNALLGICFLVDYAVVGYILGGFMTVLGGLLVIFNLCVASELIAKIFGMPTR